MIINVTLKNGTIPVNAWETGVPGLAVTTAVTSHRVIDGKYVLTHVASGKAVGQAQFYSIEVAQVLAQLIGGLFDWTLPEPEIDSEFYNQYRKNGGKRILEIVNELQEKVESNPTKYLPSLGGIVPGDG